MLNIHLKISPTTPLDLNEVGQVKHRLVSQHQIFKGSSHGFSWLSSLKTHVKKKKHHPMWTWLQTLPNNNYANSFYQVPVNPELGQKRIISVLEETSSISRWVLCHACTAPSEQRWWRFSAVLPALKSSSMAPWQGPWPHAMVLSLSAPRSKHPCFLLTPPSLCSRFPSKPD